MHCQRRRHSAGIVRVSHLTVRRVEPPQEPASLHNLGPGGDRTGFAPAVPTIADAQHSCRVTKKTQGDVEGVDISLSLRDGQSYKANIQNPSQASAGTVGSRAAVEEAEPLGSTGQCEVSIEVKPKSRATVGVTFSSDTDKACKLVESLADKLEPLLPKNT